MGKQERENFFASLVNRFVFSLAMAYMSCNDRNKKRRTEPVQILYVVCPVPERGGGNVEGTDRVYGEIVGG